MDELPELRSDEDVDALLARLRARVAPPATHSAPTQIDSDPSGHALTELLMAQAEATKAAVRALHVLVEADEERWAQASAPGAWGLGPPPQRAGVRVGGPGPGASRRSRRDRK